MVTEANAVSALEECCAAHNHVRSKALQTADSPSYCSGPSFLTLVRLRRPACRGSRVVHDIFLGGKLQVHRLRLFPIDAATEKLTSFFHSLLLYNTHCVSSPISTMIQSSGGPSGVRRLKAASEFEKTLCELPLYSYPKPSVATATSYFLLLSDNPHTPR